MSDLAGDQGAKLLVMATEIHQFFRHQGDTAPALAADHMKQFWPPMMRADFLAVIARRGADAPKVTQDIAAALEALTGP